mmetsp:Transcript_57246/g.170306  ORF Transcript_57246/g.170306 Transcript_57246/m.170306 type:complete len:262 (+) Transcript_57246:527-1312(+)
MAYASKPASCMGGLFGNTGSARGEALCTFPTTAATQDAGAPQMPAKLICLLPARSPMALATTSALSPAPAETWHQARLESARVLEAPLSPPSPRPPAMPTDSALACLRLTRKASTLCPEGVLPLPERAAVITSGRRSFPVCSTYSSMAKTAALAFSVSTTPSRARRSAPPSTRPRTCCAYAATRSSQVVLRCERSSALGDDSRWLVGPMTPATRRGFCMSFLVASAAALLAARAAALLSSYEVLWSVLVPQMSQPALKYSS